MTISSRRTLLLGAAAALAAPSILRAQTFTAEDFGGTTGPDTSRHNVSSFRTIDWRDHFTSLGKATIIADTTSRALHYWSADGGIYRVYPTSVPMSEELTRRGYSEIVRKKENPSWTPTANMRARTPELPISIGGGEVGNPLGVRALYLDWPAYLIHGTHDTRKIGRRSSSGCIGLYNEKVVELYDMTPIGAQVRLI